MIEWFVFLAGCAAMYIAIVLTLLFLCSARFRQKMSNLITGAEDIEDAIPGENEEARRMR